MIRPGHRPWSQSFFGAWSAQLYNLCGFKVQWVLRSAGFCCAIDRFEITNGSSLWNPMLARSYQLTLTLPETTLFIHFEDSDDVAFGLALFLPIFMKCQLVQCSSLDNKFCCVCFLPALWWKGLVSRWIKGYLRNAHRHCYKNKEKGNGHDFQFGTMTSYLVAMKTSIFIFLDVFTNFNIKLQINVYKWTLTIIDNFEWI